jgi:hypothetical protein
MAVGSGRSAVFGTRKRNAGSNWRFYCEGEAMQGVVRHHPLIRCFPKSIVAGSISQTDGFSGEWEEGNLRAGRTPICRLLPSAYRFIPTAPLPGFRLGPGKKDPL